MRNLPTIIYLAVAGLLLVAIGTGILFVPHAFHGSNGIVLGDNPNVLSETRAPGAMLLAGGLVALAALLRPTFRYSATQLSVLVYGSFGLARIVSIALDGIPSMSIVAACGLELAVAVIGVWLLATRRPTESVPSSIADTVPT